MKTLLSGASGFLGGAVLRALTALEPEAPGRLVRREGEAQPGDVVWDPERGIRDPNALEGVGGVIHLAGESVAGGRWTAARRRRIRESRVTGTRVLAEALASLTEPPAAMVCASAVGLYGDRGDVLLDEKSSSGDGFLAEVVRDWEAAADPARNAGIRVAHLRFGMILAPDGGALARMLPVFRLGLGGRLGDGRQYVSWIARSDAVAACLHALRSPTLAGPANAVAPEPVTNLDFTRALGRALGRPTPFPVPAFALRLAFGDMANEMLLGGQRVRPAALLADGFRFRYERIDEALGAEE